MRADLRCLLCCFSAFFAKSGNDDTNEEKDYYQILGIAPDASNDEIRRAYRRKSLAHHPDKIAQRSGGDASAADREEFQRVKEAYEVLSDARKRDIYDAVGADAMHVLTDPKEMDMVSMVDNLHHSGCIDRCKLFSLPLIIVAIIFIQPVLICLKVDGNLGSKSYWLLVLIPLWIINCIVTPVLFHRVYRSKRIKEPKEYQFHKFLTAFKFLCIFLTEIFLALKFDEFIDWSYALIFIPLYVYELLRLLQSLSVIIFTYKGINKMVTLSYLEKHILGDGRTYADLTDAERESINHDYLIVHPPASHEEGAQPDEDENDIEHSPEYILAQSKKQRAMSTLFSVIFHSIFMGLLIPKLDGVVDWNWWLVFVPVWVSMFLLCCFSCFTLCCIGGPGQGVVLPNDEDEEEEQDDVEHHAEKAETKNEKKEEAPPVMKRIDSATASEIVLEELQYQQQHRMDEIHLEEQPRTEYGSFNAGVDTGIPLSSNKKKEETSNGHDGKENSETGFDDMDPEAFMFSDEDDFVIREAKTEACGTCCMIMFYLLIVCLFVGKLQGGDGSYSTFWIIAPFMFIAAIFLCMFCCVIFCAPDADTINAMQNPNADTGESNFDVEHGIVHTADDEIEIEEDLGMMADLNELD